ncbi:DUF3231 family protein [Dethiobacter alkaliphilus]|uniref:DUF3231 family protein n=1 Tax=Dethiobacter alkaliphilus TaxID=427926 RepID=UPI0022276956|nr:DUF3231 family protein [Dethiobacter alkaliphilus]MCW3489483.1 DUF3231 family protein [Dethiobacter alkaliphilus]
MMELQSIGLSLTYNIWNWLRIRYKSLETFQFYGNLVHDRDFSLIMDRLLEDTKKHMKVMEEEGKNFKIPVPGKPPVEIKFQASINQVTDKFIYKKLLADMMAELFTISRTVRSTTTNDRLRKLFVQDMLAHVRNFELLYKFSKAKGWEDVPPTYKMASPIGKESLTLTEAFHLWDHLTQRYNQLQMTELFSGVAHDPDFKAVLKLGGKILTGQAKQLEQQISQHGVPLPERPPASIEITIDPEPLKVNTPANTEIFRDEAMFRTLNRFIQISLYQLQRTGVIMMDPAMRDMFIKMQTSQTEMYTKFIS